MRPGARGECRACVFAGPVDSGQEAVSQREWAVEEIGCHACVFARLSHRRLPLPIVPITPVPRDEPERSRVPADPAG